MNKQYVVFYKASEPDYNEAWIFDDRKEANEFMEKLFDKEWNEYIEAGFIPAEDLWHDFFYGDWARIDNGKFGTTQYWFVNELNTTH